MEPSAKGEVPQKKVGHEANRLVTHLTENWFRQLQAQNVYFQNFQADFLAGSVSSASVVAGATLDAC